MNNSAIIFPVLALLLSLSGCGTETTEAGAQHGGMPHAKGDQPPAAAVPVEVTPVIRRSISSFIETNGTLEAENEVDIVSRAAGPIVELLAEESDGIRRGQTLARLDDREYRAQLEIARVTLNEMRLAFERAKKLQEQALISPESYEEALSAYESAQARYEVDSITLEYTNIKAPFDGLVIKRYVNFAEQVGVNTPLFRISDFDPLLCPIQVPERDLPRLGIGQEAYLTIEPYPGERFEAAILRISPVVDPSTGTIKVTLAVRSRGKLRPGMFARVFVETATRPDALVIPKTALSLDSIGDTVYVAAGPTASRREVLLGYHEGDFVEVLSGLSADELVIVIGHEGLSDSTPIQIMKPAESDSR
jgi:membrane fusion protein (multidrug efflux system)